jgi:hypothetical protein
MTILLKLSYKTNIVYTYRHGTCMCFRMSFVRIIHFILISTVHALFLTCPSVSIYGT